MTSQDPLLRGAFARCAANKIGARVNMQVHMDLQVLPWWKRIFAKTQLRRADSVRVVSKKIKKQVESVGIRAPIRVLPIYIDISKFKNIVRHPSKSDLLGKTILWIGRFEAEKDPLLALAVLRQVLAAGIDIRLVMLGSGSLGATLRDNSVGLPVEFPGWRDPAAYLAKADVVLCTSKHESWGASIVEALAAGVPVVTPDVGVAREAGAVIVPREQLAKAVAEVLKSGQRGELQLQLPNAQEWARQWNETLVS